MDSDALKAFEARVCELLLAGSTPYDALIDALAGFDQAERIARGACAVLADFEAEINVAVARDGMAVARIGLATHKALTELATLTATEINLPFLFADETGPKHLSRNVTREQAEALVARNPMDVPPRPAPTAHVAPPPKHKRGWWPF